METRAQSFAEWKEGRSRGHGITSEHPGRAGLVTPDLWWELSIGVEIL